MHLSIGNLDAASPHIFPSFYAQLVAEISLSARVFHLGHPASNERRECARISHNREK